MSLEITDETIGSILSNNKLVVLDFWADWCSPCKMLSPVIEALAEENKDTIIGKVDAVDNKESMNKFGISAIPCILIIKDGVEVKRLIGVRPKSEFQRIINEFKE